MKPNRKFISFINVLAHERLGMIHWLFLLQLSKSKDGRVGLPPKIKKSMPELNRIANVFANDIGTIMQAPSQRDFRKGLLPGEEKPFSRQKEFAALVLATRGRRESFQAVIRLWHFLVFTAQHRSIPKEKLKSLGVDFLLARRGKLLRKWKREQRFKELMRKFQSGYVESLLRLMEVAIFHAPDQPLQEVSREIYSISAIITTMEKSALELFNAQVMQRLEIVENDFGRKGRDALELALVYAIQPYSTPLAKEKFNSLRKDIVTESFLLQKNTMKAITVERSKTKRAEEVASLEPLMRILQITLLSAIGVIDHKAYTDKVFADMEEELRKRVEELRKRMRKKVKRKK